MRHVSDLYRRARAASRGGLLPTIAVGWFLTLGTRFLLPAVLPEVKATFAIDDTTAGIAITVVWAGYGLMQFPAGVLVDRLDERTLLSLSLLLAGASLAVVGAAPVFPVFLVAGGLFGLSTGLFGTSRGIALAAFFRSNPGLAFGVTLGAGSVGSAALPYLGSVVTGLADWRLAVGLTVPLFLATAASTWWVVPADTDREADGNGGESGNPGGATPTVGTAVRSLRPAFADRAVAVGVCGVTIMLFTYQALTAFLPTYLIAAKGVSRGTAAGLFALLFVAGAGFQLVAGTAADRVGAPRVILVIALVGVPALAALPFVGGVLPLALLVVVVASRVAVASVMNPYIIAALPDEAAGTGWGLLRTGFFLIGATGSTVVGALADRGLFDEAFYLLAALTAVAAALFVLLPERRRDEAEG
ncbi:MAG: nitrate/nitrite transporter [Haloferacaceae archaeon]